jgi:hypothetical protein
MSGNLLLKSVIEAVMLVEIAAVFLFFVLFILALLFWAWKTVRA